MKYIQAIFSNLATDKQELLLAELSALNLNGIEEEETTLTAYFEDHKYQPELLNEIATRLKLKFDLKIISNKNWNEEWEQNFQPVLINDFCSVRARFHPQPENVLYDIVITPKMSFGTGHHATTALMITMMQKLDLKHKKVFDFGTGTGILAILAEKSGADSVFAADNDDWAIENAKENFECNAIQKISIAKGSIEVVEGQKFDIILANINRNILLENMKYLSNMLLPDGELLLSGFLAGDLEIMKTAAVKEGFVLMQHLSQNGWFALLLQKC